MVSVENPKDIGIAIRAARRSLGMTQAELAKRSGVGRQWLVQVEGGHDRAEIGLLMRVLDEVGLDLSTGPARVEEPGEDSPVGTLLTPVEAAEAIRDELTRGDEEFALRLLARMLSDLRIANPAERRRVLAEPPSTGDRRWDTLLAAAVGRECRRLGLTAPRWTNVPALSTWWFPFDDPLLTTRTMQRTPIDLSVRGIWLDGRALEAV